MTTHYNPSRTQSVLDMECDFCARIEHNINRVPIGWIRYATRKSIIDVCPDCSARMTKEDKEDWENPFAEPLFTTKCIKR